MHIYFMFINYVQITSNKNVFILNFSFSETLLWSRDMEIVVECVDDQNILIFYYWYLNFKLI